VAALLLPAGNAFAAAAPVPNVSFSGAPEAYARYVGQVACDPVVRPGTAALADLLLATYRTGRSGGITRACSSGGQSEHKDGRAWDWMLDARNPGEKQVAESFLAWLTGPDAAGVPAGNARRLGVMYVIFNGQTWKAYRASNGWGPYTGSDQHTDHIHISLSWDGAMKRTSWWTGKTLTTFDVGPCQQYVGEPAPPYSGPRYTSCPAPTVRRAVAFPRSWDGDGTPDVLATGADGTFWFHPGRTDGDIPAGTAIGAGWTARDLVTRVGDWNGDGEHDLVARDPSTEALWWYGGDGAGRFRQWAPIGAGWGVMRDLAGPGDWDGDGRVDLVAVETDTGILWLYPGRGDGGFLPRRAIGWGWQSRDLVTGVGDWDGDGDPDLLAREPSTGALWLYSGDGSGGFRSWRTVGWGWQVAADLAGPGDQDDDGGADLLARVSSGDVRLYRGDGSGGFGTMSVVAGGWQDVRLSE
jgi:hypothetical protein